MSEEELIIKLTSMIDVFDKRRSLAHHLHDWDSFYYFNGAINAFVWVIRRLENERASEK